MNGSRPWVLGHLIRIPAKSTLNELTKNAEPQGEPPGQPLIISTPWSTFYDTNLADFPRKKDFFQFHSLLIRSGRNWILLIFPWGLGENDLSKVKPMDQHPGGSTSSWAGNPATWVPNLANTHDEVSLASTLEAARIRGPKMDYLH